MKVLLTFTIVAIFFYSCSSTESKEKLTCKIAGEEIKDGESKIFYKIPVVNYNEECEYKVRTCQNGILNGDKDYNNLTCEKKKPLNCKINNNITLNHNETKIFYSSKSVPYDEECKYEVRTCQNGILNGDESYIYTDCEILPPLDCEIDGITIKHKEGAYLYSQNVVSYTENCQDYKTFRICYNGKLSGDENYIYQSCINSDEVQRDAIFVMKLYPEDTHTATDNSGNVLQGITSFGKDWFVSQDAGNGYILFNHLNSNGIHIEDWQISKDSHGQDLSWNFENNKITLYTGSPTDDGISKYQITWEPREIVLKSTIKLFDDRTHVTPTLNTDKTRIAARAVKEGDYQDSKVFLYKLSDLNSGNTNPYYSFPVSPEQTQSGQYFQGIIFYKNKFVYCLTGDNTYQTPKKIFKYSATTGEVLAKYYITAGKEEAVQDDTDGNIHYEPEGLEYKDGYIYFSIITGERSQRIKRLYKIEAF